MLVLTRRVGEQIFINKGQIEIKILYVRKGHIAVGIKAPSSVEVDRKEIYLRKLANPQTETHQEIIPKSN
ncbi:TPA: carbon storage regulator [Legionella pneumophila]|nr:carbon storage regulator [Legionella pneumophila]HCC3243940.1 carbon storage regulator [Legionella pneumophila subsp. pneumophila]HAT7972136.1 carbon storage regulator [Legionella pneumophila]HAT8576091.1 carbon storage regulator [Legionella pneumophila]HAU2216435.1 carbon storage regulator [Legionella pneumophila]